MKLGAVIILFSAVAWCGAGEMVVLTERPVELFELPTGEVLTNAYAFKRSSAGMMVIHDGGSLWMNYKTLPPDWQQAYTGEIMAAPEPQPKPAASQSIAPKEKLDEKILTVRLLRSAIGNDVGQIVILKEKLDKDYPYSAYAGEDSLLDLFEPCKTCGGSGKTLVECKTCFGTSACPTCGGDGERDTGIGDNTIDCTKCRGTGGCPDCKGVGGCPDCKGVGGHLRPCAICRGKGRIFDRSKCVKELDALMKSMQKAAAGK